jgi:heme/copper-type cytochrome/quinol oxidase subunit 2
MKEKLKKLGYLVAIPTINILPSWDADPKRVVSEIINYALFFIGAIALVFVIYGGVLYITSGGDSEKTTKARNTLMYAILGIIVVVISYAIVMWASRAPSTI